MQSSLIIDFGKLLNVNTFQLSTFKIQKRRYEKKIPKEMRMSENIYSFFQKKNMKSLFMPNYLDQVCFYRDILKDIKKSPPISLALISSFVQNGPIQMDFIALDRLASSHNKKPPHRFPCNSD